MEGHISFRCYGYYSLHSLMEDILLNYISFPSVIILVNKESIYNPLQGAGSVLVLHKRIKASKPSF
jgi:hypothetical protein